MPNTNFSQRILFSFITLLTMFMAAPNFVNAQQGKDWHVWVKTSPCSGRNDWVTVARENPTIGGLSFYYEANILYPGTGCNNGCTFSAASSAAAALKPSAEFFKYCCHDYSVWQNMQTGKMSVVVGQFGTAGVDWIIVKGNLCCEEAESLSGITGACSGTTNNNNHPPTAVKCWPGSHAVYNQQTRKTECVCDAGLVWNDTRTACVTPAVVNCWPGSYAKLNPQTGKTECYCNPGLVWNDTRTACITPAVKCWPGSHAEENTETGKMECYCDDGLVWNDTKTACVTPAVKCWPGSYAAVNPQTGKTECYCNTGLVWNDTKTACITPPTAVQCWPGSYAAVDPATGKTACYCNAGLVWNDTKTACITPPTAVQCWPGSYAAVNPQTGKTECYCNPGLVWNATNTACINPPPSSIKCWPGSYAAENPQTGKMECYCNPGLVWNAAGNACVTPDGNTDNNGNNGNNGNGGGGTWVLVSTTVDPPDPKVVWPHNEWNYSAQGSSAHYSIYDGAYTVDYSWTPPPASFGSGGFTVSMNLQGKAANNAVIAVTMGVSASGLTADKDADHMGVYSSANGSAGGSQSVTFKPGTSGHVEVKVSMGWAVTYTYKYERK